MRETLAISRELARHLREFVAWKQQVGQPADSEAPLFVGKRGALRVARLQRIRKRAVVEAGLPQVLSIHAARHTLAVRLPRKTRNLRQVQKQLSHTNPVVTANLYADVSFEDMQAGVNGLYEPSERRV